MKYPNNIWAKLLHFAGWKLLVPEELASRSVICVAPHTSNWDLPIGLLYYLALGRKPHFMIKKEWFVFPLNYLFKALGGVPIDRSKKTSMVDQVIELFSRVTEYNIAVTPEGSRSRREKWRTGFWRIAEGAKIKIELAKIDYKRKVVGIFESLNPSNDIGRDLNEIRSHYTADMAKFPEKFTP